MRLGAKGKSTESKWAPQVGLYGVEAELVQGLVALQTERDLRHRYGLFATFIVLASSFRWELPAGWLALTWVCLGTVAVVLMMSASDSPHTSEAHAKASPALVRGLLTAMHRAHGALPMKSVLKLVVAALGGVKSARDLRLHEWETLAAMTMWGEPAVAKAALETISRCQVHAVLPFLHHVVEQNRPDAMYTNPKSIKAIESVIDQLEGAPRRDGSEPDVPIDDPHGWPERDLGWFYECIRQRTARRFFEALMRMAAAVVGLRLFGLEPSGALILGIFSGYIWDVISRAGEPTEPDLRRLFVTDNVPGEVLVQALRHAPAGRLSESNIPLRKFVPGIALGARDFSRLTMEDWTFLLRLIPKETKLVSKILTQVIGRNAPASLLPELDAELEKWISSRARSSPVVIQRLTQAKMLVRSRLLDSEPAEPASD